MDTIISPLEQAAELLRESRRPLIVLPSGPDLDTAAAGVALANFLQTDRPDVATFSPGYLPANTPALLEPNHILPELPNLREFVVSVNTGRVKLDAVRYEVQPTSVQIFLTPKNGFFDAHDITTSATPFIFDRIITIGLDRLESLGTNYEQQRDFFYHTQILNIDLHPNNVRYGHVNAVDLTAVSQSEQVAELIHLLAPQALNESLATTLLTGLIAATHGFQSHHVTPRTLTVAARLMAAGAKRDDIISRLYHTKTVPVLRLWGHALANLQSANNDRLVWTTISKSDLDAHQATSDQAIGLADELLVTAPGAAFAAVLVETPPTVTVVIIRRTGSPEPNLPETLIATSPQRLFGRIEGSLDSVEKQVVGTLRTALGG